VIKTLKQTTTLLAIQTVMLGLLPITALAATFRLESATISDIDAAFDSGALTSKELVQLYLNRIAAYDKLGPGLNSLIAVNPNALQEAEALDAQRQLKKPTSPLYGIPVILKDNYDTSDLPTTAGALALKGFIPSDNAFQVQKLRDAGAIVLGKANLSEFAFSFSTVSSLGGTTLNPYDTRRTPGGSSGGTGAAIAANFGAVGLGTDTGGSIRIPATFNSLVGVRPTIGLSSRSGIIPLALSQDVGGPLTRTVRDAALALDATVGNDPKDPVTASSIGKIPASYTDSLKVDGLKGSRIGVVRDLFGLDADPGAAQTNAVVNQAIADIKSRGADIVENVTIPNLDKILSYPSLSSYEFKFNLNNYLSEHPNAPVHSLQDIIDSGGYLTSNKDTLIVRNSRQSLANDPTYQDIIKNRPVITQQAILSALNENHLDALLYPTSTNPPALLTENQNTGSANRLSPYSGFPEISVPAGYTTDGLPVGFSLLGEAFSEPTLLKLAYSYEQGTMLHRPPESTPALEGEVFEYDEVPEPSATIGLTAVALVAISLKLKRRRQVSLAFAPDVIPVLTTEETLKETEVGY